MDPPDEAATAAAEAAPSLTFAWLGDPLQDGHLLYYTSFQFCNTTYTIGDHVYLTPEDPGAPLYLARIITAFEDAQQQGGDRLCVEVQWYERRPNMPAHLQEGMHDREVVEWLQTDTNLVGCIERKAKVIKAASYDEALLQLGPEDAAGDWHFCRGVLEVETMVFRTYQEVEADPAFGYDPRSGQVMRSPSAGVADGPGATGGRGMQMDVELFKASPVQSKRSGGGGGQRRRAIGGGSSITWDRAAGAAAALGGGSPPKPGTVCYECGAKATPQWREGPAGPRTLCNACGMRYQRSQGKCITRPKPYGDATRGGGGSSGSEMYYGALGTASTATASPTRPNKRPNQGRGRGGGGKRGRGAGGKVGRAPWEEDDEDDVDYDPSFDRSGRGGFSRQSQQYSGGGYGEDEEDAGAAASAGNGSVAVMAGAGGYYPVPSLATPGTAQQGSAGIGAAGFPQQMLVPLAPVPPVPSVTPTDLKSLVDRASQFLPELSGFRALLETMPDNALQQLPPDQSALLMAIKAGVEQGLSEVKAADAAVTAVTQVLAQKKAAAEKAHEGARAAAAEFRELVSRIIGSQSAELGLVPAVKVEDGGATAAAAAAAAAAPGAAEFVQEAVLVEEKEAETTVEVLKIEGGGEAPAAANGRAAAGAAALQEAAAANGGNLAEEEVASVLGPAGVPV